MWVWKADGEAGEHAPMPAYPEEYQQEWEARFGPAPPSSASSVGPGEEQDVIEQFEEDLVGESRLVQGGLEVLVRRRGVDAWVWSTVEDLRVREERNLLARESVVPAGSVSEDERKVLEGGRRTIGSHELSRVVVDVEGLLLFREGFIPSLASSSSASTNAAEVSPSTTSSAATIQPEPFIPTPSTSSLLRTLALHVQLRVPVLLTSPPSSGKTAALTHLWSLLHSSPSSPVPTQAAKERGLVLINLADRSLDSKSLLGSLSSAPTTSTSTAGSFTFLEGPLTRALRQGRWVVLLGIDQASLEVLTVVKAVVEGMRGGREVGVKVGGGEGRWVKAGRGFMLFATRSTSSTSAEGPGAAQFFSAPFWSEVHRPALEREEVEQIVAGRYPALKRCGMVAGLIEAWEGVRAVEEKVKEGGGGTARRTGVRDLLR